VVQVKRLAACDGRNMYCPVTFHAHRDCTEAELETIDNLTGTHAHF
jgi:hypothetical protein